MFSQIDEKEDEKEWLLMTEGMNAWNLPTKVSA